ncbi:hypothetical protein NBRC10512_002722 [Rhodotorula toruloides]|uniref:F-box domain contaning protein n=1 Tax=Rhodotorula toruloides (strain NP11) TaxID=1130832 RepID=M7WTY7_RHOT1|nr:F-box domain contaning protein [Rhodotorula toruloides NP11]EMS21541.1 F-box domain contaning protein [Rhodotorula toruloides NP11]
MTGRTKHPRRASTRVSYAVARDSEDEGGEEERETDEEVVPKRRDKGKGRAIEVFDSDEGEEDEDETSEDDASDWEESRKKTKKFKSTDRKGGKGGGAGAVKKGGKKGRDVGRLEVMKMLPLELLVEIFSHLDPNDLLALSMVNKQYRSLLTSPGSKKVWEASRKRLGMDDANAGDLTEWQYAQLVYGRVCQDCGARNIQHADFYLRKRLCSGFRIKRVVDLGSLSRVHAKLAAKLHPKTFAFKVEPQVHHWRRKMSGIDGERAHLDDLLAYDRILRDLELQEEDDLIAAGEETPRRAPKTAPAPPPAPTSARTTRRRGSRPSYRDESESEDEKPESARVVEYVKGRQAIRKAIAKDAEVLNNAQRRAQAQLDLARELKAQQKAQGPSWARREAIFARVVDQGFKRVDIDALRGPVVDETTPLTDELWKDIESSVIQSLKRQRKKRLALEKRTRQISAQKSLRQYYNAFKQSLPSSAQPFVPLFLDFLALPSVKELWQAGERVVAEKWEAQLDAIREEVEHFRLDLALYARQVILAVTTDPDKAEDACDSPADDGAGLDDAFFNRATSIVCCDFPNCPIKVKGPYGSYWDFWGNGYNVERRPRRTYERREDAIGTLVAVLEHQHADHNSDTHLTKASQFSAEPRFRITLPLEVACAISALIDLGNLDYESATKSDLDELNKEHNFEWENSKTYQRFFYGDDAWKDLMFMVKRRGEKLAKLKEPEVLDPPCIVMKKSSWKLERRASIASEAAKKDGDGAHDSASGQARLSAESSGDGKEPSIKVRNSSSAPGYNVFGGDDSEEDDQASEDEQPAQRSVKVERDDSSVGSSEEDE